MKRTVAKVSALLLALLLTLGAFASCSPVGKAALTLGNNSISVGMYSLMTSIFKGTLAYGNSSINSSAYWETVVNLENGQTYEELCNEIVLETAKTNLYKLALFDRNGLTLPESTLKSIDEELAEWVDYDGDGSVNNFNAILKDYGANYDILREYMIMAAKIEYVGQYLYGGGSKISAGVKQEYLEENYVSFKQILMPYYRYLYETDENGDDIYYTADGAICYDTVNGQPVDSDGDGKSNRDKNGDVIHYIEKDGDVRICYDKESGERKVRLDSKGYEMTEEFSAAEKSEVWQNAQKVYAEVQSGNYNGFEALMLVYDESYATEGETDITKGQVYLNTDVDYSTLYADGVVNELSEAASAINIGDATLVETEYGMHIIMRYEVEDGAWENEDYAGYFKDETGISDFTEKLINALFLSEIEKLADQLGEVTVDKEAIAHITIKTIGINYNFY